MRVKKRSYAQEVCVKTVGMVMQKTGMLNPGCRIGVALSGGVDSYVLLKTLLIRLSIVPFPFEIMALHINPGFDKQSHATMSAWLQKEGIAGHIEISDFGLVAHSEQNLRRSACFRCAWLRRKRLFELCRQYHLSHLALGHNADDLLATFFLNLCRNGRVEGMSLNESFFGGALQVIRPLLLVEKKYIRLAAKQWNLPVFANACPSSGKTARSAILEQVEALYGVAHDARRCILNALKRWQLAKNTVEQIEDQESAAKGCALS